MFVVDWLFVFVCCWSERSSFVISAIDLDDAEEEVELDGVEPHPSLSSSSSPSPSLSSNMSFCGDAASTKPCLLGSTCRCRPRRTVEVSAGDHTNDNNGLHFGPRCDVVRPDVANCKETNCRVCAETGEQKIDRAETVSPRRSVMSRDIDIVGVVVNNVENA